MKREKPYRMKTLEAEESSSRGQARRIPVPLDGLIQFSDAFCEHFIHVFVLSFALWLLVTLPISVHNLHDLCVSLPFWSKKKKNWEG